MIEIKSDEEIERIEAAGKIVKIVLDEIKKIAKPGVQTNKLDEVAVSVITGFNARPAFKGYRGFPGNICTSINEQVVHGIPGKRALKEGDILSIDVGVKKEGFYADSAVTFGIGDSLSRDAEELIAATETCLYKAIEKAIEGYRLFDISFAIQQHAESCGYSVVRDFVGHGIGKKIHEKPEIPNFGRPDTGPRLKKGMVLAIEPMINCGGYEVEILSDGWTAVTKDRSLSCHFEHTVCVGIDKPRVLT